MKTLLARDIEAYGHDLYEKEKSPATIEKYTHALWIFYRWLPDEKQVCRETVLEYKERLIENNAPTGVNVTIAALNGFFRFMQWEEFVVKPLHIQRQVFSDKRKELSREEYQRLVSTAEQQGKGKLSLLLQLMASTGIRVSEVKYITCEAVRLGRAEIHLKGKIRVILLPGKLCRKLNKYIRTQRIQSGPVFLSKMGNPMSRKDIWAQMKQLCKMAGVPPEKVFPHNLRHLFARTFYHAQKDIAKLADILGHSSIETTRIYLLTSGAEHLRALERLRLIC